jgi:excisionase family DNA binding protein
MTDLVEVTILNPGYWADRSLQLAELLGGGAASPIGDPSGRPPDPDTMLTVVDPGYWSAQPRELEEVLRIGAGAEAPQTQGGSGLASGAAPAGTERLTFTVEEAATALGISRAFAYESVRRGDIPHIKIGRRVLVPKVALQRLLSSADPDSEGSPEP